MTAEGSEDPHHPSGSVYETGQEVIKETVRMLPELDDTPLHQMTPLFYQHGYEEPRMMVGDLLRLLGGHPEE
jgi:hypothetical protein